MKKIVGTVLLAVVTCAVVWTSLSDNRAQATKTSGPLAIADLRILEFVFTADNDKTVRVHIVNSGGAVSVGCILRLTVRKINGVPVGRIIEVKLPPLRVGKHIWLVINAKSILPNNVSLESTIFKLNADAASIVTESNEANNEVWHNLRPVKS